MGYLVKSWDNAVCSNFLGGIMTLSIGLYLLINWIVAIFFTALMGFGLLIWDYKQKEDN